MASESRQSWTISAQAALLAGVLVCAGYTGAVWLAGPYLPEVAFLPDTGFSWYYWKLPEPTWLTRATAWGGYIGHQLAIWWLIFHAQRQGLKYTKTLHPVNIAALGVNLFFIVLHLLQTLVWYDGLAQDVPVWSSQGSVVLLLVFVLLMENQRRGLFFGFKAPGLKAAADVTKRYHGYLFSWAVIYTFWYHPMENTGGHLLGTFYTLLIMLQGSLFFTRSHVNRKWTIFMEVLVIFHGTLVAVLADNDSWAMFFFGFATIFVVSQMHGLGWSKTLRWFFGLAYVAAAVFVYNIRGLDVFFAEFFRIPVVEYGMVFLLALLVTLTARLVVNRKPA